MQEARGQHDDEAVKRAINEYEDALARYIPVLMAQAKIYWELDMYQQVTNYPSNLNLVQIYLFDILLKQIEHVEARFYFTLQVEKIFRKSVEFCNESDTWKLNVAHVLFMVSLDILMHQISLKSIFI